MAPWCSGLTCHPVTVEIGGSNPPGVATAIHSVTYLRIAAFILWDSFYNIPVPNYIFFEPITRKVVGSNPTPATNISSFDYQIKQA